MTINTQQNKKMEWDLMVAKVGGWIIVATFIGVILYVGFSAQNAQSSTPTRLQSEDIQPEDESALLAAIQSPFALIVTLNENAAYVQESVHGVCYLVTGRVNVTSAHSTPPPLLSYTYVPCELIVRRIDQKK